MSTPLEFAEPQKSDKATHPDCNCICGGANHGAGLQRATENTREMADNWLETYAKDRKLTAWQASVPVRDTVQLPLF